MRSPDIVAQLSLHAFDRALNACLPKGADSLLSRPQDLNTALKPLTIFIG